MRKLKSRFYNNLSKITTALFLGLLLLLFCNAMLPQNLEVIDDRPPKVAMIQKVPTDSYNSCYFPTSCQGINLKYFVGLGKKIECERPCSYDDCTIVRTTKGNITMPSKEVKGIQTACDACPECKTKE